MPCRWAKAVDNSLAAAGVNQKAAMPGHNGSSLIQGVLEHFAGTEFENFAGGNGQRIAGARVAPLASLAGFYRKGAKTREGQFGLFYKSVFHRSKKSITRSDSSAKRWFTNTFDFAAKHNKLINIKKQPVSGAFHRTSDTKNDIKRQAKE